MASTPKSYHANLVKSQKNKEMRPLLPYPARLAAFVSVLLAACSSAPPATTPLAQSGPLKVHPGLLGQPVPPELQTPEGSTVARVTAPGTETAGATPAAAMKLDAAGLRTQRSIYFDLDSAEVKGEFNPALQAHAQHLADHPKSRVRIEGNADERGSADYNKRLGQKRAEAVKQSLVSQGAPEKQVRVVSLGESKPKLKGHDEESWAENRRADVVYEKEE